MQKVQHRQRNATVSTQKYEVKTLPFRLQNFRLSTGRETYVPKWVTMYKLAFMIYFHRKLGHAQALLRDILNHTCDYVKVFQKHTRITCSYKY